MLQDAASRQGLRSVEKTDVIETEEAALEHILALSILAVYPPGEVQEQLLEDSLKEVKVLTAVQFTLDFESSEGCPSMDGRVDVAKVPLVSIKGSVSCPCMGKRGVIRRKLPIRVAIPFAREEIKLLLRKIGVDHG